MAQLTSQLVVKLIDLVSGPARGIAASLRGIGSAARSLNGVSMASVAQQIAADGKRVRSAVGAVGTSIGGVAGGLGLYKLHHDVYEFAKATNKLASANPDVAAEQIERIKALAREVSRTSSKWTELPWKFEAGTMAIAEAVGWGAAIQYLEGLGMDAVFAHDRELVAYALERLADVPGLRVLGPGAAHRGGLVAFTMDGIHPHDIATVLDQHGVCVRAGHHCAMPLHEHLGVPASARASFHCYSLREDVDALVEGLHETRKVFAR